MKKRLQHRCYEISNNTYFEKYLRTAATGTFSKVKHDAHIHVQDRSTRPDALKIS